MRLDALLRDVPVREVNADPALEITSVTADSRLAGKGSLFVAIPGTATDGVAFVPQALQRGAVAIAAEKKINPDPSVALVLVDDARASLSLIAANFFGRPAERLSLVGVTGTSGKTTTTRMIEAIFDAGNQPVGLIGTIEYRAGEERLVADRTTPDAVVLQEWFARMVEAGVRNAVMEVSSHALALKRTYGIRFAAAVFTNLSRDHFDFHRDFEDYFAAKRILFDQIDRSRRSAVVNRDDHYGLRLARDLGPSALTFGRSEADIYPMNGFAISVEGLRGNVMTPAGEIRVDSPLLGMPNLYNWLGAIGAAILVGIPASQIESGIRSLTSVRGRFERVPSSTGPTVIVDYAHKPDALEKLLMAVREIAGRRRVVLLFGCGGDRDRGKRPEMGAIAGRLADLVVLTSDNPRNEEPDRIIDQIEQGMSDDVPRERYQRITDRGEAIASSIAGASDDDVIVIAGKGHETYQVSGDQIIPFDDREEAASALAKRAEKAGS